eukprot:763375-Hanusia_phi.AAC.1
MGEVSQLTVEGRWELSSTRVDKTFISHSSSVTAVPAATELPGLLTGVLFSADDKGEINVSERSKIADLLLTTTHCRAGTWSSFQTTTDNCSERSACPPLLLSIPPAPSLYPSPSSLYPSSDFLFPSP